MKRPKRPAAYFLNLPDPLKKKWWPDGGQMQFVNALRGCLGLSPIREENGAKPKPRRRQQELGGAP